MDEFGLIGKTAIVTGAGAADDDGIGNGRAAAILLARAGANLVLVDRDDSRLTATARQIAQAGGSSINLSADITQERACQEIVQAGIEEFGRVDLLDNNVGIGSRGSVVDESLTSWQRVMRINVDSMMLMSAAAIPAMRETGGGAIVNISSISALRPRGLTAYSTSKGAVIALTQAMAVDHGPENIRVNCVAPGPVYTPMVANGMSSRAREARTRSTVLGIEGNGWDVGNAVRFLLSDMARYITGQTLVVDGGVTLRGPDRDTA
ncbi:MAG: glucose 1-dehydrogenase [Pseudomonadota bacterium]